MKLEEIKSLSEKYGLPYDTVTREVYLAITEIFNMEPNINAVVDFEELKGTKLGTGHGDGNMGELRLSDINKTTLLKMQKLIEGRLQRRSTLNRFSLFAGIRYSVIDGIICGHDENHGLLVEVRNETCGDVTTALCEEYEQPPRERGGYLIGGTLPFYVKGIRPEYDQHRMTRLEIKLSRRSPALVELLIQKFTGIRPKCTRRIAGAFSNITTQRRIPKEALYKVSKILNERINVKVETNVLAGNSH
ncbi:MAG: hypothetical protein OEY64_12505 [Nitrospinota bacterium]|nr:hypothetical protein [Nitrospinota bacterium]